MADIQVDNLDFYNDMRNIIIDAQNNAIRGVEYTRMIMYWQLGERIFIEEQSGQERANYVILCILDTYVMVVIVDTLVLR